jgi:hypothetical protein
MTLVMWAYSKTKFVINATSVSLLNSENGKRVTLDFEDIISIEEDPKIGNDEIGNIYFVRYDIYCKKDNKAIQKITFNLTTDNEKKWQEFISKLKTCNPDITLK